MKRLISLCLMIFVCNDGMARPADIRTMNGWYKIFIASKKHLSPFEGFVFSKNVEKYYRFGKIKVNRYAGKEPGRDIPVVKSIVSGDANIKLLYYLFYDRWSEFLVADAPSKIAHYLDAAAIGKVIACMDRACETNNPSFIKPDETIYNAWNTYQELIRELATKAVKQESEKNPLQQAEFALARLEGKLKQAEQEDNKKQIEAFKKQIEKAKIRVKQAEMPVQADAGKEVQALKIRIAMAKQSLDKALQDAHLDAYPLMNAQQVMIDAVHGEQHETSMKQARNEAKELAQIIVDALQESGDLVLVQEQPAPKHAQYLLHTPFLSILAFLFEKVKNTGELITYVQQLPPQYLETDWQTIISKRYNGIAFLAELKNELKPLSSASSLYDILSWYLVPSHEATTVQEKLEILQKYYEEICLEGVLQGTILPPFLPDFTTTVHNVTYTACGEATILNWIQLLLTKLGIYDQTTQAFNAQRITTAMENLLTRKNKPFDPAKLHEQTTAITKFFTDYSTPESLNSDPAYIDWTALVSNVPGVKYMRRKKDGEPEIKDNKHPAVHSVGQADVKKEYGDYAVPLDDSYFLYELTAYPSGFVTLTNYLLGTACTSFASLCALFDITGQENLSKISDQDAWNDYTRCFLTTDIDNKPVNLLMLFHFGHGHLENLTETKQAGGSIITFLLEEYDAGSYVRNMLTCSFSSLQSDNLPDLIDQKRYNNELREQREQLAHIREQLAKESDNRQLKDEESKISEKSVALPKFYKDSIHVRFKIGVDSLGDRFTEDLRRHLLFSHNILDEDILMDVLSMLAQGKRFYTWIVDPDYLFVHSIIDGEEKLADAKIKNKAADQIKPLEDTLTKIKEYESQFNNKFIIQMKKMAT